MNISKIEKAHNIIQEIKFFDGIIIQIESMVNKIEHEKAKINVNLYLELPKKSDVLDEHGFIKTPKNTSSFDYISSLMKGSWSCEPEKKTEEILLPISDIFAYEIFAIVHKRAIEEREKLIKKLEKIK